MTIKGSVYAPTEIMTERETIESYCDGLKRCASSARELAMECQDPTWAEYATTFDCMRENGMELLRMKTMSRFETLMACNLKSTPYKPN